MRSISKLLVLAMLALGAGCGGGGGAPIAGIGSGGTGGVASGPITGFGSVIVNGIRFDDSGARVTIDGVPDRPVAELRLGMVVEVRGDIDAARGTGVAREILAEHALQGPVERVEPASASAWVLGQRVRVDGGTVYEGVAGLAALAPGDVVAVSGLRDAATSALVATRLERHAAAQAEVEVEGFVSALTSSTFRLESLTVSYAGAQLLAMPPGGLANGLLVSVRAPRAAQGAALAASTVRAVPTTPPAGAFIEYVGYISEFASLADLRVGTLRVNGTRAMVVGGPASALANGVRVEVEGFVVDGVVQAIEIDFLTSGAEAAAEVEGPVTDFVSAASFRVRGQWVDARHATFAGGTAAELANGRVVNVAGMVNGEVLVASAVRYVDTAPAELARLAVEGPITDFVSPARFRVNGQAVAATSGTLYSGGGPGDLGDGRVVAVEGTVVQGVLAAATLRLQPQAAARTVSLEGRISGFVSPSRFAVNGQAVTTDAATAYREGSAAQLANGAAVTVTGTLLAGVVRATHIEFHGDGVAGPAVEVEGYITAFASVASFKVAGQLVDASGATFENGHAADLANGLKVHAKGPVSGGVLRAAKVEISR